MSRLTVPPDQVRAFKALLALPDDSVSELLDALNRAGPQFNASDLSDRTAELSSVPKALIQEISSVLLSLYRTVGQARSLNELAPFLDNMVIPALKRAEVFAVEAEDEQQRKMRHFLLSALSSERSVGATAKAGPVLTEHERVFQAVRILTDLRPIYHLDVSEPPEAALVVHMMKITQRDKYDRRTDFYFALDSNDLIAMKNAIQRAEAKENALREALKDSTIKVLQTRLFY
jgi:hypothetical protein